MFLHKKNINTPKQLFQMSKKKYSMKVFFIIFVFVFYPIIPSNGKSKNRNLTVFIGSSVQFHLISNNVEKMLQTGKIGLYLHGDGMGSLKTADRLLIQKTWQETGVNIVSGGGSAIGEVTYNLSDQYIGLFGGKYPEIVGVNMPDIKKFIYRSNIEDAIPSKEYNSFLDKKIEMRYKKHFDKIISKSGSYLVLPVFRWETDTDDSFSKGNYFKNWRDLIVYAGGDVIDTPPAWALSRGDKYIRGIADQISWLTHNNLAAILLISPWKLNGIASKEKGCKKEEDFLEKTKEYVEALRQYGAIPTKYAVVNYCGEKNNITENAATGDNDPESLNQVALWLATQPVSPKGRKRPGSPGGKPENSLF